VKVGISKINDTIIRIGIKKIRNSYLDLASKSERIRTPGHVDSGKSTLMGHLLFLLGSVSQKLMHKYEKESKKIGKQSFMYAWVLGRQNPNAHPFAFDSLIMVQRSSLGCNVAL
jgi:hypothetical protein